MAYLIPITFELYENPREAELARLRLKLRAQTALASAVIGALIYELNQPEREARDAEREAYLRG